MRAAFRHRYSHDGYMNTADGNLYRLTRRRDVSVGMGRQRNRAKTYMKKAPLFGGA